MVDPFDNIEPDLSSTDSAALQGSWEQVHMEADGIVNPPDNLTEPGALTSEPSGSFTGFASCRLDGKRHHQGRRTVLRRLSARARRGWNVYEACRVPFSTKVGILRVSPSGQQHLYQDPYGVAAAPQALAATPDGSIWAITFTYKHNPNELSALDPRTGKIQEYLTPPSLGPLSMIVVGPAHHIWRSANSKPWSGFSPCSSERAQIATARPKSHGKRKDAPVFTGAPIILCSLGL